MVMVLNKTKYKGVYFDAKSNTYYVNTTFKDQDGRSIKKCKRGFATAKKANDWKISFAVELKNSSLKTTKGSFEILLDKYIMYRSSILKSSSLKAMRRSIEKNFLSIAPKDVENFRVNDVFTTYQYICSLNVKNIYKNQIISTIRNFFEWLDLTENISSNIYKKVKVVYICLKTDECRNGFLTKEEFSLFVKTFDTSKYTENKFLMLFTLLFFTGARIGEALAVTFDDIDFENNQITFDKQLQKLITLENIPKGSTLVDNNVILPYTKANTIKTVSIPKWLTEMLKTHHSEKRKFLFSSVEDYDRILTKANARVVFQKHLKLAGLPLIKIHDLRHSHTTMLYESGCDSKYVSERLGHICEQTSLRTYKHLTKERKQINDDIVNQFSL
jgi:integrase